MKHILWAAPLVALSILVAGCGGDDDSGKGDADPTAASTRQTGALATPNKAEAHRLGETGEFAGVKVKVVSSQRKSPTDLGGWNPVPPEEGWLIVRIESENSTGSKQRRPELLIVCADGSRHSTYDYDAADALKTDELPSRGTEAGTVLFGTQPNCFPATILATPVLQIDGKPEAQAWRLQ
jgi:hypothetical protein